MLSEVLKSGIRRSFGALGLEVHRRPAAGSAAPRAGGCPGARDSLEGILAQAGALGLSPATVIDVGAAFGYFTLACRGVFPRARYVLVEPLDEYAPSLREVARKVPNAVHVAAAATSAAGQITINVHPDLVGSSLRLENEDSEVNGVPRVVEAVTLDDLVRRHGLEPPFFVKVDVQGAELDVLSGFEQGLRETEYVLLEVSFFEFFAGGPTFYEVIAFMKSRGFVAYDLHGLQYRPLDNALAQVDVSFVREAGPFRRQHFYATREQRREQFSRTARTADAD
jgi:FkbM family methyltransferase